MPQASLRCNLEADGSLLMCSHRGRTLSASVGQIYTDFCSVLDAFVKVPYDVLDVEVKQFDDDFYEFRCSIKELERRLGSVLNQGFDDCATVFASLSSSSRSKGSRARVHPGRS